jgi:hypothetical protein
MAKVAAEVSTSGWNPEAELMATEAAEGKTQVGVRAPWIVRTAAGVWRSLRGEAEAMDRVPADVSEMAMGRDPEMTRRAAEVTMKAAAGVPRPDKAKVAAEVSARGLGAADPAMVMVAGAVAARSWAWPPMVTEAVTGPPGLGPEAAEMVREAAAVRARISPGTDEPEMERVAPAEVGATCAKKV